MRNIAVLSALMGIMISIAACNLFDRHGQSFLNNPFSGGNEQRVVMRSDDMSLDIKYSGDIVFNDEETAIEKMSPGGYLDYNLNGKRLLAEATANGGVEYKFYDDDDYRLGEGYGKKFLAEAISEMIAQGMFIKGRMERLYNEGGIPLLLAEVKRTKADNVKRKYLEFILQSDSVTTQDIITISNVIAKMMGSDDDKKRMLGKINADYLKDSLTAVAYFAAIESIGSDYDKANVLRKTIKESLLQPAYLMMLKAAAGINSDNDKANLLKELTRKEVLPAESYDSLLGVINTINSDYDKSNVLKGAIDNKVYPGTQFSRLLMVTSKINSDNDKATVFKKLASKNIDQENDWINFISEITSISSDNDKANVLLAISKSMPRNEKVIAAYMKSSKTINSENDYKRAAKAVE